MKIVDSLKYTGYFLVTSGWGRVVSFAALVFTAFLFGHT